MLLLINILKWIVIVSLAFFVITFAVYFFNIDMKMMALIKPLFIKHYDKMERDRRI